MPNVLIRNVPPGVQDTLKARAERQGQSFQQYLLAELVLLAARPTVAEVMDLLDAEADAARASGASSSWTSDDTVRAIREDRDGR